MEEVFNSEVFGDVFTLFELFLELFDLMASQSGLLGILFGHASLLELFLALNLAPDFLPDVFHLSSIFMKSLDWLPIDVVFKPFAGIHEV